MEYLVLTITGLIAGILGSIVGLGGGIIIIPVLNLMIGFSPEMAIGTSLFAIIFTSLSSCWGHYRAGNINVTIGLKTGAGGILGILVGSYIFSSYLANSLHILKICMGIWFLFLSFRMGQQVYQIWKNIPPPQRKPPFSPQSTAALIAAGCFIGILAGILGIGGGVIMVPVMAFLFGLPLLQAVGTTFLAMLSIALSGGLIKLVQGFVVLDAGIILGIGTAIGAQMGVFFSRYITPLMMKAIFCILFLIVSITYLF